VVDHDSLVANVGEHDDEKAGTAGAVLRRTVAWFAGHGVTVERVLSDPEARSSSAS